MTGAKIGDACWHIADPPKGGMVGGWFVLHFVRDRVSVQIEARVEPDAQAMQSLIEKTLETTANIIVRRIDGMVKAKGKVDLTNLPPIRPDTGPQNDRRLEKLYLEKLRKEHSYEKHQ